MLKMSKSTGISKGKGQLGGRDAGLAKANANKGMSGVSAKHKSVSDKFNEFRQTEADCMERKREHDHELRMEKERNKRLKYEYKRRSAEQERTARAEELRLQIEIARITAGTAHQPTIAQQSTIAHPPGMVHTPSLFSQQSVNPPYVAHLSRAPLVSLNTEVASTPFGFYDEKSTDDGQQSLDFAAVFGSVDNLGFNSGNDDDMYAPN